MLCLPKEHLKISVNKPTVYRSGVCLDVCAHTVFHAAYIDGDSHMF
jgi:hypothetical protein